MGRMRLQMRWVLVGRVPSLHWNIAFGVLASFLFFFFLDLAFHKKNLNSIYIVSCLCVLRTLDGLDRFYRWRRYLHDVFLKYPSLYSRFFYGMYALGILSRCTYVHVCTCTYVPYLYPCLIRVIWVKLLKRHAHRHLSIEVVTHREVKCGTTSTIVASDI